MNPFDIYPTIIITILGVAYPILLQVIARVEESYESEYIIMQFNSEPENKLFKYVLFSSLISLLIWTIIYSYFFEIGRCKCLISMLIDLFVSINAIALVIIFLLFINKIVIYYTPEKLTDYLIRKHDKARRRS